MRSLSRRSLLQAALAAAAMSAAGTVLTARAETTWDLSDYIVGKWTATAWTKYPKAISTLADSPQASLLLMDFRLGGVVIKTVRQSYADGSVREQAPETTTWRIGALADGTSVIEVNNALPSSAPNWVAYVIVDGSTIRHVSAGWVLKRTL